jgi:hypothetical protein
MGISNPRTELENLAIIKTKTENKTSISRAAMCGLQGSGTMYRLVVGLLNTVMTTQVTCNAE